MAPRHIVSYSELDTYRQCPLKHRLAYLDRWTKAPQDGSALDRGTRWHLVMEAHYGTIRSIQQTLGRRIHADEVDRYLPQVVAAVVPLLYDPDTGEQSETQELLQWMYEGYVANYGLDLDWLINEIEFAATVPFATNTGRPSSAYALKLRIDLVVTDRRSKVWIVDHKTCSRLPTTRELDIDDQFGLYTWAMKRLGFPVIGAVHSASRTQRNKSPMSLDDRFARAVTFRTDIELNALQADALLAAKASRSGLVYSSPNPETCVYRCDFREAHILGRKGIPIETTLASQGFVVDHTRH